MGQQEVAVIVGAGRGLSASLSRQCALEGMKVVVAARDTAKLADLVRETGAHPIVCDVADRAQVASLFEQVDERLGSPNLVVFNAGARYRAPIETVDPEQFEQALRVTALGGLLVAQAAAVRMMKRGSGSILFTGATASVKGLPGSAPFAMGKFALRGLAQCLARELAPKNIHVAHFVIDGGIATTWAGQGQSAREDKWLDPDDIAREYLHVHRQRRSAWTWEMELRPWVEKF
jgi:NAD(P)-dependent dehydrogenase (short-subunit alcohol dehydrogenase family)